MKYLTGKMASLHKVSKQTLIHYDKIGLFKPQKTSGENGYRYYSLEQFPQLDLILLLKKLGMTLAEIKKYQGQQSLSSRIAFLESKKEIIDREIAELESTKLHLNSIIATLNSCLDARTSMMGIKQIPKRDIVREPIGFPNDKNALESSLEMFFEKYHEQFDIFLNEMMVWFEPAGGNEVQYTSIGFEVKGSQQEIVPSGSYGYIYYETEADNLSEQYHKLVEHIKVSGFRSAGECIGKMVLGSLAISDRNEFLVELQIPVQKA